MRSKSSARKNSNTPRKKSGPLINLDDGPIPNRKLSNSTPVSSTSRRGPKPLVDISDARNCHYCGCSEFKYDPWKQNVCGNCHHDHRNYQ